MHRESDTASRNVHVVGGGGLVGKGVGTFVGAGAFSAHSEHTMVSMALS